jgi:hypothetical protein
MLNYLFLDFNDSGWGGVGVSERGERGEEGDLNI